MAALEGNQYYLLRSKSGRDTAYTPESLIEKANEYFEWVLNNPLYESQIIKGKFVEETVKDIPDGKGGSKKMKLKTTLPYAIIKVPKMRPFTIEGLCNYAEIVVNTFRNYEKREVKPDAIEGEDQEIIDLYNQETKDFLRVTGVIRQIIENQQFEGAASNFLNANIIARKLGLGDKQILEGNPDKPLGMATQTIVVKERKLNSESN